MNLFVDYLYAGIGDYPLCGMANTQVEYRKSGRGGEKRMIIILF